MGRTLDNAQVLAIDPGGVHCGMAWFADGVCVRVEDTSPNLCVDLTNHWLLQPASETLVIEEFRLYPWLAAQQSFSTFATVETIGALKLARRWNAPHIDLVMQPAAIKKPTERIMKARNTRMLAHMENMGVHCADAELHAYHYTHKTGATPK
jgi:hypothetical protein